MPRTVENESERRIPINLRLPKELVDWVDELPTTRTAYIESLIRKDRAK